MLSDALMEMSRKAGMTAIVDANNVVLGIFTDGDLRRTLEKKLDFGATRCARDVIQSALHWCRQPGCKAVQLMEQYNINQMLV